MSYTFTASYTGGNTFKINIFTTSSYPTATTVYIYILKNNQKVTTVSQNIPANTPANAQFLRAVDLKTNTTYTFVGDNSQELTVSSPVDNTAKVATQTQWEDLTNRINSRIKAQAGTPTTSTYGVVGQLLEDTTNGKLYQCTAIDTTDPINPSYTWSEVGGGGGPTVVQATGTSQTDVMSQNAVTNMIYKDPGTNNKVVIGTGADVSTQNYNMAIGINASGNGTQSTAIGYSAKARPNGTALGYNAQAGTTNSQTNTTAIGQSAYGGGDHCTAVGDNTNTISSYSTAIGASARARSERSVAIGAGAQVDNSPAMAYSVALGANSKTTRAGEVNVGTGDPAISTDGFNSSAYRVIGGVYDGQDLHDAATVAQGNTLATTAPDTSTVGVLGQLWTDTTNMHTYQCTAISGSTYTWTQRW